MNVHSRLEEERRRIRLDRDQMASAGGVALRTYANYVAGGRAPDSNFLAGVAAAGADVLYILTGQRCPQAEANSAEPEVVEAWSKLTAHQQGLVLALMRELAGCGVETQSVPLGRTGPQLMGQPMPKVRKRSA